MENGLCIKQIIRLGKKNATLITQDGFRRKVSLKANPNLQIGKFLNDPGSIVSSDRLKYESVGMDNLARLRTDREKFLKLCLSRKRVFWWNLPYDLRVLLNPVNNLGLSLEHFSSSVDGLYLLYLADTNVKSGRGLKEIGHKYLGIPVESFEDAVGEDIKYSDVKSLITYAGRDALMTLEISERLYKFLMKRSPVLVELDIWLQKAIYTFEEQEYDMDLEYIDKLEQEVSSKLEEMKAEFYEKHGLINLGSSKQKADLLLAKGFSTVVFSEKTGQMSVSATALQNLIIQKGGCKPAELMDKISKYEKLLGSYIHSTQKHENRLNL